MATKRKTSAKGKKKKIPLILHELPGKGKLDPKMLEDLFRRIRDERLKAEVVATPGQ